MSFKILYITATQAEADTLKRVKGIVPGQQVLRHGNIEIATLVTGVGSIATAWAMNQWLSVNEKPDLAINAGIAGSYKDEFAIGDVVMPVSDCFADAGIEEGDKFYTLAEAGFIGANEYPFSNGLIEADPVFNDKLMSILKPVKAITVNTATGSEATIIKLLKKYNPDIETMEGATFFYICAREKISFLALRSISNRVEPRDKSKWNISLALESLSEKLEGVLIRLE